VSSLKCSLNAASSSPPSFSTRSRISTTMLVKPSGSR
jgi:hypothetical protein